MYIELVWNLLAYQRMRFDINYNSSIMTYAKHHPLPHALYRIDLGVVCVQWMGLYRLYNIRQFSHKLFLK